ncbi:hypothetical protein O7614_16150 [Micromonospora sp. WMMD961]|uniref:hypothetical protein n=1 Tax=Micromonospora sp. WMMD961 TaxID=3016100 RepID=UPI0024173959|nr:hypothetical protein [Micromonospora sp. WMMD961]MDG4781182.1 hypothetical protein [Micromonospora sp. WMMD961]
MRRRQATSALVVLAFLLLIIVAQFAWPEVSPALRYLGGGLIAVGLLFLAVGFAVRERRRRSDG